MENFDTELTSLLISQAATAAKIVYSKIGISQVVFSHPVVSNAVFYPALNINEVIPSLAVITGQEVPSIVVSSFVESWLSFSYDISCNAQVCSDLVLSK